MHPIHSPYFYRSVVVNNFPDKDFFWAPPTPRTVPTWLAAAHLAITKLILQQVQDHQTRILPLPGFQADPASLDPDGVHFMPAPGMHYCMHLIDHTR